MADEFDIYSKLNEYLKDIGQSPEDCGGTVTFTGADPIVRSHFRIGS